MTDKKPSPKAKKDEKASPQKAAEKEIGGFGEKGNGKLEPTRYNDWEVDGRCSDF